MADLQPRQTVDPTGIGSWYPNVSAGDNGPAKGESGSGLDWGSLAATGISGGLAALFGSGDSGASQSIQNIKSGAASLQTAGQKDSATGEDALAKPLSYFKGLLGNREDLLSATAPDRARVMDQYDAARKSSAQFTPRGGGQASASVAGRNQEAGDLATVGQKARGDAATALSSLGINEKQVGASEQEAAINEMATALQAQMKLDDEKGSGLSGLFGGIGNFIGAALFA